MCQTVCIICAVSFIAEVVGLCSKSSFKAEAAFVINSFLSFFLRPPYGCREIHTAAVRPPLLFVVSEHSESAVRRPKQMLAQQYDAVGIIWSTQEYPNCTFSGGRTAVVANASKL